MQKLAVNLAAEPASGAGGAQCKEQDEPNRLVACEIPQTGEHLCEHARLAPPRFRRRPNRDARSRVAAAEKASR